MKALLALNESTTAEILADLLQIPPEQAQQIAGQLRLSEILNLVQELKANNMLEANEILKPYLAELKSLSGASSTSKPTSTNQQVGTGASGPPGRNYPQQAQQAGTGDHHPPLAQSDNTSSTAIPPGKPTVKAAQQNAADPEGGKNLTVTVSDEQGELFNRKTDRAGGKRVVNHLPKMPGSAVRAMTA
tara:strand:- start:849 stop:1412 length:564 start_codon:yes stop_codon:yes gene_type:complete